jgi:hypothetical protein
MANSLEYFDSIFFAITRLFSKQSKSSLVTIPILSNELGNLVLSLEAPYGSWIDDHLLTVRCGESTKSLWRVQGAKDIIRYAILASG